MYNLSACAWIRNSFSGAYCLPETMCQFMHLADEMLIMDLGSTDGTLGFLIEVAKNNPKVKVISEAGFPRQDAGVFADLANELIDKCQNENVLYWQADEFWHEDLLALMEERFKLGQFDLSFWRIQFANNFQYPKWYPHLVHRVGQKNNFRFVGDGMNTDRVWDAKICSNYGGEMFPKWGELGQDGIKGFVNEMITDVSLIGGFRDNIPDRRNMHAPFWHEEATIPYHDSQTRKQTHISQSTWRAKALDDPDWLKTESPYNLPKMLRYHVGRPSYLLRPDLVEAIKKDKTSEYILLI